MARALSGEKQLPLIRDRWPQLYSNGWGIRSERCAKFSKRRDARHRAFCSRSIERLLRDSARINPPRCLSKDSQPTAGEIDNLRDVKGVILWQLRTAPSASSPLCCGAARFDYILPSQNPALPIARRLFISDAGMCRFSPDLIQGIGRADGRLHWRDIESLCRRPRSPPIVEFSAASRLAPFVVTRGDFLAGSRS